MKVFLLLSLAAISRAQFEDGSRLCLNSEDDETCYYLNENYDLCNPNSVMFSQMAQYCALTCGLCPNGDPDDENVSNSLEPCHHNSKDLSNCPLLIKSINSRTVQLFSYPSLSELIRR